jgi:hypothetical protein
VRVVDCDLSGSLGPDLPMEVMGNQQLLLVLGLLPRALPQINPAEKKISMMVENNKSSCFVLEDE